MQSTATFLGIIMAMAVLVLVGVGFSLFGSGAKPQEIITASLATNNPGGLLTIPNSAKAPFILTATGDRDQQLVLLDKRRGSRVVVPSIRSMVQLQGEDSYLLLYAYHPDRGSLYFLEVAGVDQKPVRYWAMNTKTLGFHSLRTPPPPQGTLSPGELYVAYATGETNGELRELHVIALFLDTEKSLAVLGGEETLTVSKNKYSGIPQAKIEWRNDKTVGFGVSSSEFPINDGRPVSEMRTVEVR